MSVSLCEAHRSDYGAQGRAQYCSQSKSGQGVSTKTDVGIHSSYIEILDSGLILVLHYIPKDP